MIFDDRFTLADLEAASGAQLDLGLEPEPVRVPWVFSNHSEWSSVWDCSEGPLDSFKGDLKATHTLLAGPDDFRPGAIVPRYVVREIELPSWLIQGWTAKYLYQDEAPDQDQAYTAAVDQAARTLADPRDSPLMRALKWLVGAKPSKFVRSLREQWADMGRLSPGQVEACRDFRPGRGR